MKKKRDEYNISEKKKTQICSSNSFKELLTYSLTRKTLLLELITVIGMNNTLKLIKYFGGGKLDIPSKYEIKQHIKQITIYKLHKEGYTIHRLKKEYNISLNEVELKNCINRIEELEQSLVTNKHKNSIAPNMSDEELHNFIDSIERESIEQNA